MGHLVTSFDLVRRWTMSWKVRDLKIMWSTHGIQKTKATEWAAPENRSDENWNCPIDNALPGAGVRQKCRWWRHSPEEMHRNLSEYASDIGENGIFGISEKCFTSQAHFTSNIFQRSVLYYTDLSDPISCHFWSKFNKCLKNHPKQLFWVKYK